MGRKQLGRHKAIARELDVQSLGIVLEPNHALSLPLTCLLGSLVSMMLYVL